MRSSQSMLSLLLVVMACGGNVDQPSPDASAGGGTQGDGGFNGTGTGGGAGTGHPSGGGGTGGRAGTVAGGGGAGGIAGGAGRGGGAGGFGGAGTGGFIGVGGTRGDGGFVGIGAGGFVNTGGAPGTGGFVNTGGFGTGAGGFAGAGGGGTGGSGPSLCYGVVGGCANGAFCDFGSRRCGVDGFGVCQPVPQLCPLDCLGICGCDGRFYCNACLAHVAGTDDSDSTACLSSRPDASTLSCGGFAGGVCQAGMFCDFASDAFCGAADQTGQCQPRPGACPTDCPGVCGCNGQFYCNACIAHAAGTDDSGDRSCIRDGGTSE
ncbi:MAG TPA: hypothetical protein VGL13_04165 [Polyangiaceae bacterium]